MRFFFDESGDFDLRKKGQFNFVGALICPDSIYTRLCDAFSAFKEKAFGSIKEEKGSRLTITQRYQFLEFIHPFREDIRISISAIHPEHMDHDDVSDFRRRQTSNYEKNKADFIAKHGDIPSELRIHKKLIRTASNPESFSDPEFVQANVSSIAVHRAFQTLLFNYYEERHCSEYEKFDFVFDRKNPTKLSAYEKHIKNYMLGQWEIAFKDGQLEPLIVIPGLKAHSHFNELYKLPNGRVNLSAIFQNGFQFQDSKSEPGLQIIDIILNSVYSAVHNRRELNLQRIAVTLLSLSCRMVREKIQFLTMRSDNGEKVPS